MSNSNERRTPTEIDYAAIEARLMQHYAGEKLLDDEVWQRLKRAQDMGVLPSSEFLDKASQIGAGASFNKTGSKYLRPIRGAHEGNLDVYAVIVTFDVKCPAIQHALKKLLCAGLRNKNTALQDLREARDAITRAIQLREQADNREKQEWIDSYPDDDDESDGVPETPFDMPKAKLTEVETAVDELQNGKWMFAMDSRVHPNCLCPMDLVFGPASQPYKPATLWAPSQGACQGLSSAKAQVAIGSETTVGSWVTVQQTVAGKDEPTTWRFHHSGRWSGNKPNAHPASNEHAKLSGE